MPKQPNSLPKWQGPNIEPKRKYKFLLTFGDIPAWVVKTAGRPKINVSEGAKHNFLSHEFKFPGRVTWDDLEISLVDPIDPAISSRFLEIIRDAGYRDPSTWNSENELWKESLSKRKFANNNLGEVSVKTIDSAGKTVESWTLHNAWVKSVAYSDAAYDSEEIMDIRINLSFDYATLQTF